MAVVVFDAETFRTYYPAFSDATRYPDAVLSAAFDQACAFLGNTDQSVLPYNPDQNVYTRQIVLYKATCHILTLEYIMADQPGRITSASEGSVSTGFDLLKGQSYTADWWAQTPCGRALWALMLPYIRGGRLYTSPDYHPWG